MSENSISESEKVVTQGPRVAALVRDLMFASRVRGSAPGAAVARGREGLVAVVGPATRLVIVELEAAESVEAVAEVRERAPEARVVAFGPHVLGDLLEAARGAGAEVLTRGAFVKRLPALVAEVREVD